MDSINEKLKEYIEKKFSNITNIKDISREIISEAYLRYKKAKNQDPVQEDYPYIQRIAYNLAIDKYNLKHWEYSNVLNYDDLSNYLNEHDKKIQTLDKTKEEQFIKKTLSGLKDVEKDVIQLKYYENLDFHQISEKLNIKYETVRTIHKRTLKKLKPQLSSFFGYSETGVITPLPHITKEENEIKNLIKRGNLLVLIGKIKKAEELIKESIEKAYDSGNTLLIAFSLNAMGSLLSFEGFYDDALNFFENALTLYAEHEDELGRAKILGNIGNIYNYQGQLKKAEKNYKEAIKICEDLSNFKELRYPLGNLGVIYQKQSKYQEAIECFKKMIEIGNETNDRGSTIAALCNIGSVLLNIGKLDEAMDYNQKCLEMSGMEDNAKIYSNALGNIALIYDIQGNFKRAVEYYQKQIKLCKEINNKRGLMNASCNLAGIKLQSGEYDEALKLYETQLEIALELKDEISAPMAYNGMAYVYQYMKNFEKADELYEEFIPILEEKNLKSYLCQALANRAEMYFDMQRFDESEKLNLEALQIAEEIEDPIIIFQTKILKSEIDFRNGDKEKPINDLKEMLEEWKDIQEQARIYYELYKFSQDEEFRQKGIELYQALFQANSDISYSRRIKELQNCFKDD